MAYSLLMTGFTQPDSMPATIAAWRLILNNILRGKKPDGMYDDDRYPHLCPLRWAGGTQSYTTNACLRTRDIRLEMRTCQFNYLIIWIQQVNAIAKKNLWHHQVPGVDVDAASATNHHNSGKDRYLSMRNSSIWRGKRVIKPIIFFKAKTDTSWL